MKRYFNELVQVDDIFQRPEEPLSSSIVEHHTSEFDAKHVMSYYYTESNQDIRPKIVQTHMLQSVDEMATFQQFRFQAVMLSLPEVKVLAQLVLAKETDFRKSLLLNVINFAKKLKEADDSDHLFDRPLEDTNYLLFLEEHLPDGMESSYVARLHRSHTLLPKTDDFKQRRVLSKVKEAIRNLLFSLDSFAMFFESKDDSSLAQIVDFVLKFSYLFETRKSSIQEKIPLKILAQYLNTHLEQVPEDFRVNNFRKLYVELITEYELRYAQKHIISSQNKQLLLTCNPHAAINLMEKHISDIKQEQRVQLSSQRGKRFATFLTEIEVAVCIHNDYEGRLCVASQKDCPHTKLEYVGNFVMGAKRPSLNPTSKSMGVRMTPRNAGPPGHAQSVEQFAEEFCKIETVKDCIKQEEDHSGVGSAFFSYLQLVKQTVTTSKLYINCTPEEIEETLEDVDQFISRKMYTEVFPKDPTVLDSMLHTLTKKLTWVTPEHLEIPVANRNEVMWTFAIKALKEIDDFNSPVEKLNSLVECITIIVNVLELCGNTGSGVSADDSLPIIIYVVIKAQPIRMHSNLNYISRFRDQEKMMSKSGFCFAQIQSAIEFIERVNDHKLKLSDEEFGVRMA